MFVFIWHDCPVHRSLAGKLLVATPLLVDPNFYRTVVLVVQHDPEGVIGLVLNRPTSEKVGDHLPTWSSVVDDAPVFFGGPVEPDVAIGLTLDGPGIETGVPLLTMGDISSGPDVTVNAARIYAGYAGWGSGQLEDEIDSGSWYVVESTVEDPFGDPSEMWRSILRRQDGHLSVVSTYPDDAELN
jgi:putative transcriptional regulator